MSRLRSILRAETAEAHAKLDTSLVEYDLTTRRGLTAYLQVHRLARRWLGETSARAGMILRNPETLFDLDADLSVLGAPILIDDPVDNAAIHPLGLTYVVAGSSLGSKVLYKAWSLSDDVTVLRASRFMTRSKDSADWADFLRTTDGMRLSESEIDDIVASANAVFSVYEAANNTVRRSFGDGS